MVILFLAWSYTAILWNYYFLFIFCNSVKLEESLFYFSVLLYFCSLNNNKPSTALKTGEHSKFFSILQDWKPLRLIHKVTLHINTLIFSLYYNCPWDEVLEFINFELFFIFEFFLSIILLCRWDGWGNERSFFLYRYKL